MQTARMIDARPPDPPWGLACLRRTDGRSWREVLEPILADTAGLERRYDPQLERLDLLIDALLKEHRRWPFPEQIVHLGPADQDLLDATTFASNVVGLRAERLSQAVDLTAGALDALERGSVQRAAVTARALFELAAVSQQLHKDLATQWAEVHGNASLVHCTVTDAGSLLWRGLWKTRMGTRMTGLLDEDWPSATNVTTYLTKFAKGHDELPSKLEFLYAALCEATHPNIEAQAGMWRLAPTDSKGRHRVFLEPTKSQSPTKILVVEALRIALLVITNLARDLWWVAAEIACVAGFKRKRDCFALGLPVPGPEDEACCCGSGVLGSHCNHPQPAPLSKLLWANDPE